MKNVLVFFMAAAICYGCSKDEPGHQDGTLVSPELVASVANVATSSPLTGVLQAYPCEANSSIYFGNYDAAGQLSPLGAFYAVLLGEATPESKPVSLPVGEYNILYWGITEAHSNPTYPNPGIKEAPLRLNEDLATSFYTLRKYSGADTTYLPVFDYIFGTQEVHVGKDKLSANLQRVTSGLRVIMKNKNDAPFDDVITDVRILVGNIPESLNFYTAKAEGPLRTISFPLTRATDNLTMENATAMAFPSSIISPVTILITLKNGAVKTYTQPLASPLSAGVRLTLTLILNEAFTIDSPSGSFDVSKWVEQSQTMELD